MKKFFIGALMAFALMGGVTSEASSAELDNQCCRDGYGYGCPSDCETYDGDYCGRYGCGR